MYKILSQLAGFYRLYDKNILMCFFDSLPIIAVHLQNANAKSHKVV